MNWKHTILPLNIKAIHKYCYKSCSCYYMPKQSCSKYYKAICYNKIMSNIHHKKRHNNLAQCELEGKSSPSLLLRLCEHPCSQCTPPSIPFNARFHYYYSLFIDVLHAMNVIVLKCLLKRIN